MFGHQYLRLVSWYVLLIPGCPYMGASWWVRMKACLCFIVPVTTCVTITPYLSRDTTYCYRHCKGISRFPLLLHHPSPRPMPDRITSASLTFIYVITPYRTHDSNPITRIASWTISFLCYLHPIPLDVIMTYDSDPDSDPHPFHDIIAYQFLTIRPLPLTLTIRKAIRYWLSPLHDGHSPYL